MQYPTLRSEEIIKPLCLVMQTPPKVAHRPALSAPTQASFSAVSCTSASHTGRPLLSETFAEYVQLFTVKKSIDARAIGVHHIDPKFAAVFNKVIKVPPSLGFEDETVLKKLI